MRPWLRVGKRGENVGKTGKPMENPWKIPRDLEKNHGKPYKNPKKIEHEIMRDLMVVFFLTWE